MLNCTHNGSIMSHHLIRKQLHVACPMRLTNYLVVLRSRREARPPNGVRMPVDIILRIMVLQETEPSRTYDEKAGTLRRIVSMMMIRHEKEWRAEHQGRGHGEPLLVPQPPCAFLLCSLTKSIHLPRGCISHHVGRCRTAGAATCCTCTHVTRQGSQGRRGL